LRVPSIEFAASLLLSVILVISFKYYIDLLGIIFNMKTPGYGSVTLLLFSVLALSIGQKIADDFVSPYGMRIHT
jgi:hypothetical protein